MGYMLGGVKVPRSDTCSICLNPIDMGLNGSKRRERGVPVHVYTEGVQEGFEWDHPEFGQMAFAHLDCVAKIRERGWCDCDCGKRGCATHDRLR